MSKVISFRVTPKEEDVLLSNAPNGDLSFYVKSLVFDTHGDRARVLTLIKEKEAADRAYQEASQRTEQLMIDAAARDKAIQDLRDQKKTLGVYIEKLEIDNERVYIEKESMDIPMINMENKVFKYRVATGIFAILFGFTLIALGICLKTNLF